MTREWRMNYEDHAINCNLLVFLFNEFKLESDRADFDSEFLISFSLLDDIMQCSQLCMIQLECFPFRDFSIDTLLLARTLWKRL
jgi:hypothetical protein